MADPVLGGEIGQVIGPDKDTPAMIWARAKADVAGFFSGIGRFFEGAYKGVTEESLIGKAVAGTKKIMNDITSTTSLLPLVVIVLLIGVTVYMVSMGKAGKKVIG
jgi:hypothetical protein